MCAYMYVYMDDDDGQGDIYQVSVAPHVHLFCDVTSTLVTRQVKAG